MKPTLWIISELFYPEETSTAYIMTELANALSVKYSVKVICGPEVYDANKKRDANSSMALSPGVELHRVKGVRENKKNTLSRIRKFLLISKRLYEIAESSIKEGEKVFMVSNPFPLIVMMGRLRRRRNFTLSMLVHDVFPEGMIQRFHLRGFVARWVMNIFNKAYGSTDLLISLGRDMCDLLGRKTNGKVEIVQIENWGDTENILPSATGTDDILTIQYAGNIGRAQNIKEFIDLLKEAGNPSIRFDVWGTGEMEDSLKNYVDDIGLSDTVSFKGAYFRSQQNEVLNSCDIALVMLNSRMYGRGVPSKTYNILAAGKPVLYIGPEGSEIGLMVQENGIGYSFDNSSADVIASLLRSLKKSDLSGMGEKSRALAEGSYSKQAILKKFVDTI